MSVSTLQQYQPNTRRLFVVDLKATSMPMNTMSFHRTLEGSAVQDKWAKTVLGVCAQVPLSITNN